MHLLNAVTDITERGYPFASKDYKRDRTKMIWGIFWGRND